MLPALLVFALGLSMTVAPLTAAVLAGVENDAGIASGVNNAVARVAGLLGTAAVGAAVSAAFAASLDSRLSRTALGSGAARAACARPSACRSGARTCSGLPAVQAHALRSAAEQASLHSFHLGMAIAAALVAIGGLVGAIGRGVAATRATAMVSSGWRLRSTPARARSRASPR